MPVTINGTTNARIGFVSATLSGFTADFDGTHVEPGDVAGSMNLTLGSFAVDFDGTFASSATFDGNIDVTLDTFVVSIVNIEAPITVGSIEFAQEVLLDDSFDSRVQVPLPAEGAGINSSGNLTYEFWLAPSSTASDNPDSVTEGLNYSGINGNIIFDRDLNNQEPGHLIGLSNGQLYFSCTIGGAPRTVVGSTDIRDGQFHHCVVTRNSTTGDIALFVDGSREDLFVGGPTGALSMPDSHTPLNSCGQSGTASCANSDPFLVIGTEKHEFGANGYVGLLSQLRISNNIRYSGTTYTVPSTPMQNDANTVGLWNWNEGSGTASSDYSGNNQTATRVPDANGPNWNTNNPYVPSGSLVTTLSATNTLGSSVSDRVDLFGQAFARGDVASGQVLGAAVNGSTAPLQTMRTSTWPDGSLQFAVFAVVTGGFVPSQTKTINLITGGTSPAGSNITVDDLPNDIASNADLTLGAQTITVSRTNLQTPAGTLTQVFTGPHCAHWIYREAYSATPRVYVRFDIYAFRSASSGTVDRVEYAGGNEVIAIQIGNQGSHGTVSSSVNRFRVNGSDVLNETVPLYQYSRWWEHNFNLDIHIIHDPAYLADTGVLWGYDSGFTATSAVITSYQNAYNNNDGINETAGWRGSFAGGGSAPEIGPVPGQDICYIAGGQDVTMRNTMLRMHQRAARHQIHMWDDVEGRPVQIGPNAGQFNVGNINLMPFIGNNAGVWGSFPDAGYSTDCSHLPRFAFVPYLLTGRDWYLEEMQFWAGMACGNDSGGGAYLNSTDYNIVSGDQIRGEGWGLCSILVAALLTPDSDSMRSYFQGAMSRNLEYTWTNHYAPDAVITEPFGWTQTGQIRNVTPAIRDYLGSADYWVPWMQDFILLATTWAWKTGFDGSGSLADYTEYAKYLAKNTVGKIHKFGFQNAALYWTILRNGTYDHQYWHELREDLYNENEISSPINNHAFRPTTTWIPYDEVTLQTAEPGTLAWRNSFNTNLGVGESIGFPNNAGSDMLITWAAIHAAVELGAEGAETARDAYITITNKPDTTSLGEPQFDLASNTNFPHQGDALNDWIQTNITTGATWTNATANLGNNLEIHTEAQAYSGGAICGSTLAVLGGGHNNGLNDAVALLDFRRFDTVGWYEEIRSTADKIGVPDSNYTDIYNELVTTYDTATPGGGRDSRGAVMLSKHTYDCMAPLPDYDGFMIYDGALPYEGVLPAAESTPWGNIDLCDIWKYRFSQGWEYITQVLVPVGRGILSPVAALDPVRRRIWIEGKRNDNFSFDVFYFDPDTNTFSTSLAAGIGNEESSGCFNEDDDRFVVGMGYGDNTWSEFNPGTNAWDNNSISGTGFTQVDGLRVPCITYVPARFGANYGAYFGYDVFSGALRRRDPTTGVWSTIATGGPTDSHMYGRFGFEPNHQVFYAVAVVSGAWRTYLVRPYAHNPNEGQ